MKITLEPRQFTRKDAFVRAALNKDRDMASIAWNKEQANISRNLTQEVARMSKQELARRLIRPINRPARRRAVIDDSMRRRATKMSEAGRSAWDIATELGISIPSVYNITK